MITRRKFLSGLLASTAALLLPVKAIAELIPKPRVPKMIRARFDSSYFNTEQEDEWADFMAEEIRKEIDEELLRRIANE